MADGQDPERIVWIDPHNRGIITANSAHFPRRLLRYIRSKKNRVIFDHADRITIDACANSSLSRPETWINNTISSIYNELFDQGHCHTIGVYDDEGNFKGGLYGITMGRVFFGESMVSKSPRASQIALAALMLRVKRAGFAIIDCQFLTPHLQRFGCIEVSKELYLSMIKDIIKDNSVHILDNYQEDELLEFAQKPLG